MHHTSRFILCCTERRQAHIREHARAHTRRQTVRGDVEISGTGREAIVGVDSVLAGELLEIHREEYRCTNRGKDFGCPRVHVPVDQRWDTRQGQRGDNTIR